MQPLVAPTARPDRLVVARHLLMCPPTYFEVSYSINPWMDVTVPIDRELARRQWEHLREAYRGLGHRVDIVQATAGLPDMVFVANAGIVHRGRVLVARFAHAQRQPESEEFLSWFRAAGYAPASIARRSNEGEGDVLTVGGVMLAGFGSRTVRRAHDEIRDFFEVPVVALELADPRFYHLDTAMTVLDERTVAYYPGAFSEESAALIEQLFPDPIRATEEDACGFGLNAMSDGFNVILSDRAPGLCAKLAAKGFNPITVDMSEFIKAGGSVKCCTLELRP